MDIQLIDEAVETPEEKINNASPGILSSQTRSGVIENQPRGGSWVDEFEDLNSVQSKSNLVFMSTASISFKTIARESFPSQ